MVQGLQRSGQLESLNANGPGPQREDNRRRDFLHRERLQVAAWLKHDRQSLAQIRQFEPAARQRLDQDVLAGNLVLIGPSHNQPAEALLLPWVIRSVFAPILPAQLD